MMKICSMGKKKYFDEFVYFIFDYSNNKFIIIETPLIAEHETEQMLSFLNIQN